MLAKLYLLFPLKKKKCLADLTYEVTDVSAPALRFNGAYNGLFFQNTVFVVCLFEKKKAI